MIHKVRLRSVVANTAKKINVGLWRVRSVRTIVIRRLFPTMARTKDRKNGIPIQWSTDSRPGIPISGKTEGSKKV